jgi:hypothetical protein
MKPPNAEREFEALRDARRRLLALRSAAGIGSPEFNVLNAAVNALATAARHCLDVNALQRFETPLTEP